MFVLLACAVEDDVSCAAETDTPVETGAVADVVVAVVPYSLVVVRV